MNRVRDPKCMHTLQWISFFFAQQLQEISSIISHEDYLHNSNDQSVIEICINRVTSCIKKTHTIEKHCAGLVNLLETCLRYNLQPSGKEVDPPHAKISSDIISSIFLVRIQ